MARARWFVLSVDAAGRPCAVTGPYTLAGATDAAEVFISGGDAEAMVVNTAGWSSASREPSVTALGSSS